MRTLGGLAPTPKQEEGLRRVPSQVLKGPCVGKKAQFSHMLKPEHRDFAEISSMPASPVPLLYRGRMP